MPLELMKRELLISLHRHWVWADRTKEMFEYYLNKEWPIPTESLNPTSPYFISSLFTCMCLWYALLYATCDGIEQEAKIMVVEIAPEYEYLGPKLPHFRNAMFHVQAHYWSPKLMSVITDKDMPAQIRKVHDQVGNWIKSQVELIVREPKKRQ